jgi:predicted acyltransferase
MSSETSAATTRKRITIDPTGVPAEPVVAPPGAKRLISLDAFRGWTMFWIVGGEALVVGLKALAPNALTNGLVYELSHTEWQGLRFYDLIWPSFMLMTGMSVPLSYAKRSLTQTHQQIFMRVLRRFLVLSITLT